MDVACVPGRVGENSGVETGKQVLEFAEVRACVVFRILWLRP